MEEYLNENKSLDEDLKSNTSTSALTRTEIRWRFAVSDWVNSGPQNRKKHINIKIVKEILLFSANFNCWI